MREGVGGSILFYIILGILAIFIVFIAVVMSYATNYRINNYVVTMIEQSNGQKVFGTEGDTTQSNTLVGYLRSNHYYNGLVVTCNNNSKGAVFHVTTKVNFEIPMLDVKIPIYVNNDTKTLFNVDCENVKSKGEWEGE
ncbi:MAG: hypothetical protein IKN63_02825 [Bacilli bacterium]|nr:hypothetical protein [Bacilli bacterium]